MTLIAGDQPSAWTRAEEIARESGGNPLFVAELARHYRAVGPRNDAGKTAAVNLDDVLWNRIRSLPEEARRLLEVVAISGRPIQEADACKCIEGMRDGRSAVALLRSGRLIRGVPGSEDQIESYHDRVRETILARLGPETVRDHHRRLALTLQASGLTDPEVLGNHFRESGDIEKAGGYFAKAADRAVEILAFDRAASFYRLALELTPAHPAEGRRLRTALGDALANAGRGAEAAQAYLHAAEGGTVAEALELRRRTAMQYLISGHIDDGLAALRAVLATVGMRLPAQPWQSLLSYLVRQFLLRLRGLGYRRCDPSQIAAAELTRIDVCWSASTGLSVVDFIRGADFQTRCLLLALRAGELSRIGRTLAMEAAHHATRGLPGRHRTSRLLAATEEVARQQVDDPYVQSMVMLAHGVTSYLECRWKDAWTHCKQASEFIRERCTGVHWERHTANAFGLWALSHMGEFAELSRRWPLLLAEARDRGDLYSVMNLSTYLLTIVRMASDEPQRAREEVGQAMAHWSRGGYHVQHNDQAWGTAQLDLYSGRGGAAYDLITWNWPALRRSMLLHVQFIRVAMYQLRARCALSAAEAVAGPAPLLSAAAADARRLDREATPWALASSSLIRAALANYRGNREEAVRLLTEGASRFDAIPMTLCAEALRRRLGILVGGETGSKLVATADAWMSGQGIRRPDLMTDVYAPGFNLQPGSASADATGHHH
jgi:hypothetical protein